MGRISKLQETGSGSIEAEACAWIAQLDGGEPSPEDLAAFREWVHRSPRHEEEVRRLSALWSDLNILTELAVSAKTRNIGRYGRMPGWSSACAAVVLMLAVFFYFQLQPEPVTMPQFHSAAVGEQRTIDFPDGSVIQLNTASQIKVDYSDSVREVRLLQGEAFFDVAHDPKRPFVVYAGENRVRAVGTAFIVHMKQRNVEVLVTEGAVELASVPEQQELDGLLGSAPSAVLATVSVGQRARFGRQIESIQDVRQEEIDRRLSWREGMLVFSGEPLSKVVEEVSRYTPMKIIIVDESIGQIRIGGYFRAGEMAAMLETLEDSFDIHVERVDDTLVRLHARA